MTNLENLAADTPVCGLQNDTVQDETAHREFVPPFCPRAGCPYHLSPPKGRTWYWKWGFFFDAIFGRVQRFRCLGCQAAFSTQTFSTHYHIKRYIDLPTFTGRIASGATVRSLARLFGRSTGSIANRTDRLMRQALVLLADCTRLPLHTEDLCADGFRTFTVSQYFPCDVNILVGQRTDLLYGLDYALLRRSGSMTDEQKRIRAEIDRQVSFDGRATEKSFARLLDTVVSLSMCEPGYRRTLWTDRHPAYTAAWDAHAHVQHLLKNGWITRQTVSSRAARTSSNPLRAVNYMDREIRKDRADHHRETVCFARNVCMMLARLTLYFAHHNMLKKYRILGSRSPGPSETMKLSHARCAGISAQKQLEQMSGVMQRRRFLSRELLPQFYEQLWRKQIPTPLKVSPERVPLYALQ